MTYTATSGLRDREFSKFGIMQAGSTPAVATRGAYNTIKTYQFPAISLNGSNVIDYTDYKINGEILAFKIVNNQAAGSVSFALSGATSSTSTTHDYKLYQRKLASGTIGTYDHIMAIPYSSAGILMASESGGFVTPVADDIITFCMSGCSSTISGTDKTYGPVTLYYR